MKDKDKEKYRQMSRAQRKVAIARDVIKLVNAGALKAKAANGYMIRASEGQRYHPLPARLNKKNIVETAMFCHVCARGGMMVARIARFGGVELNGECGISSSDTQAALEDAYTLEELQVIEAVFEGHYTEDPEYKTFARDHHNANDRLIAIMQNIIDHKGVFKPEVRYDVGYINT